MSQIYLGKQWGQQLQIHSLMSRVTGSPWRQYEGSGISQWQAQRLWEGVVSWTRGPDYGGGADGRYHGVGLWVCHFHLFVCYGINIVHYIYCPQM